MDLSKENPKFKFGPIDSPNFPVNSEIDTRLYIGQPYLEVTDTIKEKLKEKDIAFQIKLKMNNASYRKKITDLLKGLFELAKTNDDIVEEYEFIFEKLKFDFTSDESYVNIVATTSDEEFFNVLKDEFSIYDEDFEKYPIDNLNGKSVMNVKGQVNPIGFLQSSKVIDFVNTLFNFSCEGVSDNQGNNIVNFIWKYFDIYGDGNDSDDDDDILKYLKTAGLFEFLKNYKVEHTPLEFNTGYSSEELKKVIYKWNDNFQDEDDQEEWDEFINSCNKIIKYVKNLSGGFFKPYFEILGVIDWNQFEISFCRASKAMFFQALVKCSALSQFVSDNFIN